MELIHTSGGAINEITSSGMFDSFLFFSSKKYVMSIGKVHTYSVEIDEDSIIDANLLFYHEDAEKLDEIVTEFCKSFEISDRDLAEDLISERADLLDITDEDGSYKYDAERGWEVQLFTARAARILGFRGVQVTDEQGAAYMIDMLNKENELVLIEVE